MKKKINSIVISGGGFNGAFAVGVESIRRRSYDLYVGTSTGALVCIMIAQGKNSEAKKLFLSSTNKSIYDRAPFDSSGELRKGVLAWNFVMENPIGTTNKLLETIRREYTQETHRRLKKEGKEIVVVVTDMSTSKSLYKSNMDHNWKEFTKWVWISTLAYPYTATEFVDGVEYGDGGFSTSLPIDYAIQNSDIVRAIVLDEEDPVHDFRNDNIIQGILSIPRLLFRANLIKDIQDGRDAVEDGKNVEMIFMKKKSSIQPMIFKPSETYKSYVQGTEIGILHD